MRVSERPAPDLFRLPAPSGTKLKCGGSDVFDVVVVFELLDYLQVFLVYTTIDRIFDALPDIG
jgi:hypothetical protein